MPFARLRTFCSAAVFLSCLPAHAKDFRWADFRSLNSMEPFISESFRVGLLNNMYDGLTGQKVREAVYLAIDVPAIVDKVMKGFAYPANLPISPFGDGFNVKLNNRIPADLERARKLLAEAGYPNGFEMPMQRPTGAYNNDEAICLAISAMLERIGIKTSISTSPFAVYLSQIQNPGYKGTLFLYGWNSSNFSADSWMTGVFHTRDTATGEGFDNSAGFSDSDLDLLSTLVINEASDAKRQAYYDKAWGIAHKKFLLVPLFHRAEFGRPRAMSNSS